MAAPSSTAPATPEELIATAALLGLPAIAVTDHAGLLQRIPYNSVRSVSAHKPKPSP